MIAAVPRVKRKFTPRLRTWKLRDPACAADFEAKFEEKCSSGLIADSAMQSTEEIWDHLKSTLNSAAEEVCGYTKNHQWKRETWWWDMKVDEAVKEKQSGSSGLQSRTRLRLYMPTLITRALRSTAWQSRCDVRTRTSVVKCLSGTTRVNFALMTLRGWRPG